MDMIVKQGSNKNRMVQSKMDDIKEKASEKDKLALPDEKESIETAERTRLALEALMEGKIKSSKASTVVQANEVAEASYIRYTPNPTAPGFNPAAKQRVIKMVEAQVDPMEPPKHKITKTPRGPPSPPVPVLHSPPRKITVEDQQAWKVPPCISNWKNARGFIIPLDKRLAADGRGLQEVTINNKFAMLSEALYISERKAAEDLRIRNDIRKKITMKEKEEREEQLREMASRARLERSGVAPIDGGGRGDERPSHYMPSSSSSGGLDSFLRKEPQQTDEAEGEELEGFEGETEEEKIARQQRERIRLDRRREREREMRLDNMKGNMRKNKVDRDEGRDVSEKIALGMLKGTGQLTAESMFDSRLFNQSAGMDAGFGPEDEYTTYSKPLFDRGEGGGGIYRPKKDIEGVYGDADTQIAKLKDTSKFKPDKGFKGAEPVTGGGGRDAPVQFERGGGDRDRGGGRGGGDKDYYRDRGGDSRESDRDSRDHRGGGRDSYYGDSSRRDDRRDPFGIEDMVGDRRQSKRARADS